MSQGQGGGRPLKFKSVKKLQEQIDAYFESCWAEYDVKDKDGNVIGKRRKQIEPYTITDLALYLDTSRETLINYEKRQEYFDTIKKAKEKIHAWVERQLYRNTQVTGVIFNLKNNFGWVDKKETEHSGQVDSHIKITFVEAGDEAEDDD